MELRQLRYFVAVAEELHFGRAAERLGISQPPLTVTVKKLEAELGVPLLDRDSSGVRLTAAGSALLEDARGLLATAQRASETARRAAVGAGATLRLGFSEHALRLVAADVTLAMRQWAPDVTLENREISSGELSRAVHDGAVDAGFGLYPDATDGLVIDVVRRDLLQVALPAGHDLCAMESVPASELSGENLLLFPRAQAPRLHDHLLRSLRQAGLEPKLGEDIPLANHRLELVAHRRGLALTTHTGETMARDTVELRPLRERSLAVNTSLVWRADDPSPALERLIAVVGELVAETGWLPCTPIGRDAERRRKVRAALLRFADLRQVAAEQLDQVSKQGP
jgi:DNA-binding transcriptional LysR family regulator